MEDYRQSAAESQAPATATDAVTMAQAPVDAVFRNGTVTVIGVIAGFTLSFVTSWAAAPYAWQVHDLIGLVPLLAGVIFQLFGLVALLYPESLERRRYDHAIRLFVIGLVLVVIGVTIALTGDAVLVAEHR
jgi:uncharacterized membrane protein